MPEEATGGEDDTEEEDSPPPGRCVGRLQSHRDVVVHLGLQLLQVGLQELGLVVEVLDVLEAVRCVLVEAREHYGFLTHFQEVCGVVHLTSQGLYSLDEDSSAQKWRLR